MCEQCTPPEEGYWVPEIAVSQCPALADLDPAALRWVLNQMARAREEERENAGWLVRYHWWGRWWFRRLLSPYRPRHLSRLRYAWLSSLPERAYHRIIPAHPQPNPFRSSGRRLN